MDVRSLYTINGEHAPGYFKILLLCLGIHVQWKAEMCEYTETVNLNSAYQFGGFISLEHLCTA